eukprot:84273_1
MSSEGRGGCSTRGRGGFAFGCCRYFFPNGTLRFPSGVDHIVPPENVAFTCNVGFAVPGIGKMGNVTCKAGYHSQIEFEGFCDICVPFCDPSKLVGAKKLSCSRSGKNACFACGR